MLRVNSPGGSVFGSELVRRELELTRAAGKPVVVSMGDLAASGGYWISTASDEIIADPSTVTGSIGVIALLPNFAGTLDKLGVHSTPLATTWLRSAFDPRVPLDPRLADMIQRSVDHDYRSFIARVAQARKTTPDKIDAVAQGRVWSGAQALERGLIDRLGLYGDALRSAAKRASLGRGSAHRLHRARAGRVLAHRHAAQCRSGADLLGRDRPEAERHRPAGRRRWRRRPRELGWLSALVERRKPFDAVAHCLCTVPF